MQTRASSFEKAEWTTLALLAALVLGFGVYSNSLDVPFYFDDAQNIVRNTHIRMDSPSWAALREAALESPHPRRALAYVSFALNYWLGGYELRGYHLVNITIHLLNALLVFALVRITLRLSVDAADDRRVVWTALLAASLWLVHPLHTQTVTYVVERWNSLAVMFYLSAFLCYVRARVSSNNTSRGFWFILTLVSGGLSMVCKEIAAVLPLFLFLYEWYFFRALSLKWLVRAVPVLLLVLTAFLWVSYHYMGHGFFIGLWEQPIEQVLGYGFDRHRDYLHDFSLAERLWTQTRVVILYIGLLLLPYPAWLNLDHDFSLSHSLLDPIATLFATALIIALLVLAAVSARRSRLLSFGILWFFGHLLIESTVFNLELVYEHRTYLPSIGMVLLFAGWAARPGSRAWPWLAAVALLLPLWSYWTYERNAQWTDPVVFWQAAAQESPGKARIHNNLGIALFEAGRMDDAERHFSEAIRLYPKHFVAYTSRGAVLERLGDTRGALRDYDRAIELYGEVRLGLVDRRAVALVNRGNIMLKEGEVDRALADFDLALAYNAEDTAALSGRALARQRAGHLGRAIDDYTALIRLQPGNAVAYCNRGLARLRLGKPRTALSDLDRAIALRPDYTEAYGSRGNARKQLGNTDGALRDYQTVVELDPNDYIGHSNIGVIHSTRGDYGAAAESFAKALEAAPVDWPQAGRVKGLLEQALARKP